VENQFSWDKLADAIWVDQPVGTGFSTADTTGYSTYNLFSGNYRSDVDNSPVANEDQMGQDFVCFAYFLGEATHLPYT
jgi:carboxypeptidase D